MIHNPVFTSGLFSILFSVVPFYYIHSLSSWCLLQDSSLYLSVLELWMNVFLSVSLLPLIIPTICGYLSLAHSLSILVVLKFYADSQRIYGKNSVDVMTIIKPTDFEEKESNLAHSSIICNVWITLTFLLMSFFPQLLAVS